MPQTLYNPGYANNLGYNNFPQMGYNTQFQPLGINYQQPVGYNQQGQLPMYQQPQPALTGPAYGNLGATVQNTVPQQTANAGAFPSARALDTSGPQNILAAANATPVQQQQQQTSMTPQATVPAQTITNTGFSQPNMGAGFNQPAAPAPYVNTGTGYNPQAGLPAQQPMGMTSNAAYGNPVYASGPLGRSDMLPYNNQLLAQQQYAVPQNGFFANSMGKR